MGAIYCFLQRLKQGAAGCIAFQCRACLHKTVACQHLTGRYTDSPRVMSTFDSPSSSPSSLVLSWSSPTSLIFLCAFLSFLLQRELLKNNPTLWGKRTHLSQRRSLIYSCGCVPGHTGLSVEEPRDSAQLHCVQEETRPVTGQPSLTTNVRERTICFTWP